MKWSLTNRRETEFRVREQSRLPVPVVVQSAPSQSAGTKPMPPKYNPHAPQTVTMYKGNCSGCGHTPKYK